MSRLTLHNADIGYRTGSRCRLVLSSLSATLHAGTLCCLVGRNGCGKSTLLRTLAGLQPTLSGDVLLDDVPIDRLSPGDLARRIGVVTTTRPELTQTTVRDLVTYGRLPYTGALGAPKMADRAAADAAIAAVGINDLAERRIATLSDGERQKAFVAKTLAQGTDIILMDEPSAFLDYVGRRDLMRMLQRLAHDEHKAILVSTHDLELLRGHADQVWWIDDNQRLRIVSAERAVEELI